MIENVKISGLFDSCETEVELGRYFDPDVEKNDGYIASYKAEGKILNDSNEMLLHAYEKRPGSSNYSRLMHLCRCRYSSPYYSSMKNLVELYNNAIESKVNGRSAKEMILDFVRNFDPDINDISLLNSGRNMKFVVDSDRFPDKIVDLSSYGEGIIRIFEMALCFSSCRNGVLLIDELETGIHYSMLVRFTEFIQRMAEIFNVQVFLTTHSRECVDAFIENGYSNDEISAYSVRDDGEMQIKYLSGERLEQLIDLISFDLRGGK